MSHSIETLERDERLMVEAHNAEIKQHWYQAAILWRRLNDFSSAEFCENILQYLAEKNLDRLPPKQTPPPASRYEPTWRER